MPTSLKTGPQGTPIEDTKKHLAVAHEEFEDGTCRQVTVVPKELIVEVQKLCRLL